MSNLPMSDDEARRRALEPDRSFIVQAPAGAGKTELLTQRYLALLGTVERPEEILAITFTKKAAAEMRSRVLEALTRASQDTPPEKDHERHTWELARRARGQDTAHMWSIEQNPGRLRIQTIDSFCLGLAQQMPMRARLGAMLAPEEKERAQALYSDAAYATLALLGEGGERAKAVEQLLRHLDSDVRRAAELLVEMLARRDQWLRHVGDRNRLQRGTLEAALANVVRDALSELERAVPPEHTAELLHNLRVAAANLRAADTESPIRACHDLASLPGAALESLPVWSGVAELLLTREGGWRKAIDKRVGFRAASGEKGAEKKSIEEAKRRVTQFIDALRDNDRFRDALHRVRALPSLHYDDAQWEVLNTLVDVLPLAAAQLKVEFAARGRVDFTEIAQAALNALGEPDAPTDLLLALDYRLRHVLVDEFQDTSQSQFELLIRLTAGWTAGDGRTLFLVGDPMQSIYRFREADVGLYLRATHSGVGSVRLEKLTLRSNFRSQAGVVDWVNASFAAMFPTDEDIGAGAVPYSPCAAIHPSLDEEAVTLHPFFGDDVVTEAQTVVSLVQTVQARNPASNIAILVRNKGHVAATAAQLRRLGVPFLAVEIDRLTERQVVQDVLALTRALLHTADRPAWLALLRAPWCGLTLADFDKLIGQDTDSAVWALMQDEQRMQSLSDDGRARLQRVRVTLAEVLERRGRTSLRRFVEGAWIALGGPAGARDDTELSDVDVYLDFLDEFDDGATDLARIVDGVRDLFAGPDAHADERLQIMTIHKSKGLEFDTVIVPGLGRKPRSDSSLLLQWTERVRGAGQPDLLLAPIHATGMERDAISEYLRGLEQTRARNEDLRLLYVATTRARRYLHLLGHVSVSEDDKSVFADPAKGSLLAALWPVAQVEYRAAFGQGAMPEMAERHEPDWDAVQDNQRLVTGWRLPEPPSASAAAADLPVQTLAEIEFDWAGETARRVGVVVHRWLLRIGLDGLSNWNVARVAQLAPVFALALARLGVPEGERAEAVERVQMALTHALEDERARWLLTAHPETQSEYALTGVIDGRLVSVVLDRTFVDDAGVRWIVDYKTSLHEGTDIDAFLDQEQTRYRYQLERYARLLALRDSRPIRLGLYFPLLRGWREWTSRSSENV